MSKHTPGPWGFHSYLASGRQFGIETADHRHGIAAIHPNVTASSLIPMEQHEANARLIATAPELLSLLEVIVADEERPGFKMHNWTLPAAKALIAKAKGGAV